MLLKNQEKEQWRGGVYLCTATGSFDADLLESKLRSEGIPCMKKYEGAGNYVEIFTGQNTTIPIELYVPAECLEDATNIIVPVDLDDCQNIED